MNRSELNKILASKDDAWLDYPFGEDVAVYKVGPKDKGKMFAIVEEKREPLRVSLKCDPLLADSLRQKYDTVMPGYHLNKKHWNTIVLTGQLSDEEIEALITHSYILVAGGTDESL